MSCVLVLFGAIIVIVGDDMKEIERYQPDFNVGLQKEQFK